MTATIANSTATATARATEAQRAQRPERRAEAFFGTATGDDKAESLKLKAESGPAPDSRLPAPDAELVRGAHPAVRDELLFALAATARATEAQRAQRPERRAEAFFGTATGNGKAESLKLKAESGTVPGSRLPAPDAELVRGAHPAVRDELLFALAAGGELGESVRASLNSPATRRVMLAGPVPCRRCNCLQHLSTKPPIRPQWRSEETYCLAGRDTRTERGGEILPADIDAIRYCIDQVDLLPSATLFAREASA
jgi:hypothetical protein